MRQRYALIESLKRELKRQGKTYKDAAVVLKVSESSVKRLFTGDSFSLERLDSLCEWLGLEFGDLVRLMEQHARPSGHLTPEQEKELVSDIKLLLMAHFLLNGVDYEEIIAQYEISDLEGVQLLARLDRMKLIELLPGNRVRLQISRRFEWIPGGAIQRFYEKSIQTDFLKSQFAAPGEHRAFLSGLLTRSSNGELIRKLRQLETEFNELTGSDQIEALEQRFGTSLMIALRPWEPEVFASLRRVPNTKVW